tara:strand:- start:476 stop:787 length:312 start_codon:yes stop_codon:yes gene_type:complete
LFWAYTFIKAQGVFSKKTGILFTIFVSKISWITFIIACYYGIKNFSFYFAVGGIIFSIVSVQMAYWRFGVYIKNKINDDVKLLRIKTVAEYLIIGLIIYYILF